MACRCVASRFEERKNGGKCAFPCASRQTDSTEYGHLDATRLNRVSMTLMHQFCLHRVVHTVAYSIGYTPSMLQFRLALYCVSSGDVVWWRRRLDDGCYLSIGTLSVALLIVNTCIDYNLSWLVSQITNRFPIARIWLCNAMSCYVTWVQFVFIFIWRLLSFPHKFHFFFDTAGCTRTM